MNSSESVEIDLTAAENRINARLRELGARLDHIEHDLDQPASQDVEDRATEREDDEMLESLGQAGLAEIAGLRAALTRIRSGAYGVCLECGATISPERLIAVPQAVLCRDCARAAG